jgi:putative ubiquitin-RnfH superfamily antitoxin RatB of RatAB toxin-antitoxin module
MSDEDAKSSDRIRAAETVLNRAWGTPEQSVAVSGSMASMAIDTSKLDTKSQEALLNAVVGIYGAQNTDDEETTDTD